MLIAVSVTEMVILYKYVKIIIIIINNGASFRDSWQKYIEELMDKSKNENTKNSTESWKNVFKRWENEKNLQASYEQSRKTK